MGSFTFLGAFLLVFLAVSDPIFAFKSSRVMRTGLKVVASVVGTEVLERVDSVSSEFNDLRDQLCRMGLAPQDASKLLQKLETCGFTSTAELLVISSGYKDKPQQLTKLLSDDFNLSALEAHKLRAGLIPLLVQMDSTSTSSSSSSTPELEIMTRAGEAASDAVAADAKGFSKEDASSSVSLSSLSAPQSAFTADKGIELVLEADTEVDVDIPVVRPAGTKIGTGMGLGLDLGSTGTGTGVEGGLKGKKQLPFKKFQVAKEKANKLQRLKMANANANANVNSNMNSNLNTNTKNKSVVKAETADIEDTQKRPGQDGAAYGLKSAELPLLLKEDLKAFMTHMTEPSLFAQEPPVREYVGVVLLYVWRTIILYCCCHIPYLVVHKEALIFFYRTL